MAAAAGGVTNHRMGLYDAILIKNFHTIQTGFSTVENKIQEKKKSGKKSSTTVSTTQIEQAHVVTGELLKYR